MSSDISARTTHDLWVESRAIKMDISRPSSTSIRLVITYPLNTTVLDGAVITIGTKPITSSNYPADGTQYTGSLDYSAPVDSIGNVQVVAFYSSILGNPMPGVQDPSTNTASFVITISNTSPNELYYASIHGCTNVLQYYPIGVQTYPLESSRIEKDSSTYTGNIPSLPQAPTNPTVGFVYNDQQLGSIQYWTGTTWISTRADQILTGPSHPASLGHVYLYSASSSLRLFDGTKWVVLNSSNLQIRNSSSTFVPVGTVSVGTSLPPSPLVGDFVFDYTTQRGQFWDGLAWQFPGPTNTLYVGGPITPAFVMPLVVQYEEQFAPTLGQLFYNTSTQSLDAWTGISWRKVNTDQAGTPSTDKMTIGTDGSYDERIRLIKILKAQLGWPQNCLELKEEQFNVGIDNALDNYRQLSDGAYKMAYIMFPVIKDQQVYYLNNPLDRTDRIVDVQQIHRLNVLGLSSQSGQDSVFMQGFLAQYYSANTVDILSMHLLHNLSEEFERMFAGNYTYLWDEASRELTITRKVARHEKIIIECTIERTEQELLLDRWCKQFIQNWALAECKMMLGVIRSRFSSGTPGAAGTITQNGELLMSEARQDMTELKQELLDYEYGGHIGHGNVSFLFG